MNAWRLTRDSWCDCCRVCRCSLLRPAGRPDSERLQSLAKTHQTTVIEVLHSAIEALEHQEFLRGLNQDYKHLQDDPERWQQYLAECQEWDALA